MKLLSAPVSNKIKAQRLFKRNVPVTTLASGLPPVVPTPYALVIAFHSPPDFDSPDFCFPDFYLPTAGNYS
nr:hypothetical protein [Tanacetum cinerariifolium]